MILSNRFAEEDKALVCQHKPYCWICGCNQSCSLHHIKSVESDSILNGILLCLNCHKEADGHNVSDEEYQSRLLNISIKIILEAGYVLKERDGIFYNNNRHLYEL